MQSLSTRILSIRASPGNGRYKLDLTMPAFLYQVLAFANLRDAWHRVRGNRGCGGGDGETLEQFEINLDTNLAALRNEVLHGTYEPRPLLSVVVEAPGKQPRRLAVPAIRDRVLQTAVASVLTPLFEAEFEDCSFAYRRGRSVDQAVRRIMQYRNQGFRWVVDADIASFRGRPAPGPLLGRFPDPLQA